MIITKRISTSININDCIGIYVNPDNIFNYIVNTFKGKCYAGCYIREIKRLVSVGDCEINKDGFPDFGILAVTFDVEAIVYAVGEIINGCVVKNHDSNGTLICGTDICHIMITPNKLLNSINKGQFISIRVGKVKYSIGVDKISICAIPYLPNSEAIVYKMGPIPNNERHLLASVLSRINYEEAEKEKIISINAIAWNTFSQLLYAYNEIQPTPADATIINIKDIMAKNTNIAYISRDPKLDLTSPVAYAFAEQPAGSKIISNYPASNVLLILLEDYCAYLRTIREFINIYSDQTLLTSHANLWKIYKKVKS